MRVGLRTLGHSLADLRAHPWRGLLSGASLCIGVLAVVAVATVGVITQEVFVASAEQAAGRLPTWHATFPATSTDAGRLRAALAAADAINENGGGVALLAAGQAVSGVGYPDQVERNEPLLSQPVTLLAGRLDKVRRLPIVEGRWLDPDRDLPIELIVNQAGAARWGGPGTRLSLLVDPSQPPVVAVVVGVMADAQPEPTVMASMIAFVNARPAVLTSGDIEVLLHHPQAHDGLINAVAQRIAAAVDSELQEPVRRADSVEAILSSLSVQQLAFLGLALLTLVISAIGILNIGLASVQERARELVIRRAIGATRAGILAQMLLSASLIGLFAAAIAIGIAAVGVESWVPQQIPPASAIEPPGLPWIAVLWGVTAACTTTLIGSALPAIVAARLDIAAALRD